jgi:hypothetical protein
VGRIMIQLEGTRLRGHKKQIGACVTEEKERPSLKTEAGAPADEARRPPRKAAATYAADKVYVGILEDSRPET